MWFKGLKNFVNILEVNNFLFNVYFISKKIINMIIYFLNTI